MKLLPLLLVLAILVSIAVFAMRAQATLPRGRQPKAIEGATWRAAHFSRNAVTHVVVRREDPVTGQVLDERELATVPDGDPDYDAKFMEALATAHSRAALFNTEEN